MKRELIILRINKGDRQTLGYAFIYEGIEKIYEAKTMELPWRDNRQFISCIPADRTYYCEEYISDKLGRAFHIHGVPNRYSVAGHVANYSRQLKGCIAFGKNFTDIDNDGLVEVTSSRKTLNYIQDLLGKNFKLTIVTK